ncbi:hypothetical protein NLI96_g11955 [Meripilus lineatus]|uniref:Uncharacterized protein n=1 Tax=Meripilus lineatus TaxID=2056292 RepID=A0AAD5Y8N8_9APHY|nr:hypothetical protein NLI96_g11955 [Physisporinus lineatus]
MGPISFTSSTPHPPILTHLLSDVDILVGANAIVAEAKFERAREDLERYLILFLRRRRTPRTRWRRVGDLLKRRVQLVKLTLESVTPVSSDSREYAQGVRKTLLASVGDALNLLRKGRRLLPPVVLIRSPILEMSTFWRGSIVEAPSSLERPQPRHWSRSTKRHAQNDLRHLRRSAPVLVTFGEKGVVDVSVVSAGLGALTMVGGKTLGVRGLIEGMIRGTDLFGNETVRKRAAPVLGAVTIGTAVYLVWELPSMIPKTVGRRIQA